MLTIMQYVPALWLVFGAGASMAVVGMVGLRQARKLDREECLTTEVPVR